MDHIVGNLDLLEHFVDILLKFLQISISYLINHYLCMRNGVDKFFKFPEYCVSVFWGNLCLSAMKGGNLVTNRDSNLVENSKFFSHPPEYHRYFRGNELGLRENIIAQT